MFTKMGKILEGWLWNVHRESGFCLGCFEFQMLIRYPSRDLEKLVYRPGALERGWELATLCTV